MFVNARLVVVISLRFFKKISRGKASGKLIFPKNYRIIHLALKNVSPSIIQPSNQIKTENTQTLSLPGDRRFSSASGKQQKINPLNISFVDSAHIFRSRTEMDEE